MATVFVKQTNEEGEEVFVEVDVSEVLTEDVIKQTDVYGNLLSESIERRQKNKQLRDQLASLEVKDEPPSQPESIDVKEPETPPPTPTLDEDALFEKFMQKQRELAQQEQQAKDERQAMINRIAKEMNVPASILRGNTEEELKAHAKSMIDAQLVFPTLASGSSADTSSEVDALQNVFKKLNLGDYNPKK